MNTGACPSFARIPIRGFVHWLLRRGRRCRPTTALPGCTAGEDELAGQLVWRRQRLGGRRGRWGTLDGRRSTCEVHLRTCVPAAHTLATVVSRNLSATPSFSDSSPPPLPLSAFPTQTVAPRIRSARTMSFDARSVATASCTRSVRAKVQHKSCL